MLSWMKTPLLWRESIQFDNTSILRCNRCSHAPVLGVNPEVDAAASEEGEGLGEVVNGVDHLLVGQTAGETGAGGNATGVTRVAALRNAP